jgi:hypothetical protein
VTTFGGKRIEHSFLEKLVRQAEVQVVFRLNVLVAVSCAVHFADVPKLAQMMFVGVFRFGKLQVVIFHLHWPILISNIFDGHSDVRSWHCCECYQQKNV